MVEPCPVSIKPSAAVYPMAALSPAEVSAVASTVPPVMTPVVVIALAPLFIAPNPLVIEPAFKAPVVTILELPATADAPMSDNTSAAERPSIAVPSIRKKSLSAAPDVKVATFPLEIPADAISDVKATVPAEDGKVTVTSAVEAGPIRVTAFVPLSVSSLNKIDPAAEADPVNVGAVKLLFVRVSVDDAVMPPISDKTSAADLPSIDVPATFKKSSSATPLVKIGILVFEIPNDKAA